MALEATARKAAINELQKANRASTRSARESRLEIGLGAKELEVRVKEELLQQASELENKMDLQSQELWEAHILQESELKDKQSLLRADLEAFVDQTRDQIKNHADRLAKIENSIAQRASRFRAFQQMRLLARLRCRQ